MLGELNVYISADSLTSEAAYKLLVGCVVPRPIAWVTTLSKGAQGDHVNAAPFSAFTFVSSRPPMVGVSIGRKIGKLKDTARNILERQEFVVNIGNLDLLDKLHLSAQEFEVDISETDTLSIAVTESKKIKTPRIADAPVSLECKLHQVIEFGTNVTGFYVGEVVMFHIRDGLVVDGKIETKELRPICRLGGPHYAELGEIITKKTIFVSPKDHGI
jgi:flavin reductase (DIM6/NTAB) family NADH-FMN oxidoreductase RutF